MKRTLILSAAAALLLSTSTSVFADKITRKSESKLTQGTISTATSDLVTIKDGIGKISQVPTNDIIGIDWETNEPSTLPLVWAVLPSMDRPLMLTLSTVV